MSKAVRIREHLYAEIASLAKAEHRSLISQLEVLLEQVLQLESSGAAVGDLAVTGSGRDRLRTPTGTPVDGTSGDEQRGAASAVTPSHPAPVRAAPDTSFLESVAGEWL